MKFIDNKLYLGFSEMVNAIANATGKEQEKVELYLRKAKSTGTKCWTFLNDPDDRRRVLVQYEALKEEYKKMVKELFGNPYDFMAKEPILKMVHSDQKAEAFFLSYTYSDNRFLPTEHVTKYVKAASWLNMLNEINRNKKLIKKQLNVNLDQFWNNVCSLIKSEGIDLPASYQRLRNKMTEYQEKGYACLIDWRFGNSLAKKIDDDVLKKLLEHPNQYDDVMICYLYNNWARQNDREAIGARIVSLRRKEWEHEIIASREGWSAYNEKYVRQVKGLPGRTMHPLALVECDDYNFNYYFTDPDMTESGKDLQRYVGYIVADSSIGLVLGASYRHAKAPVFDMVRVAWLDAMYYIRSLTGGDQWYLPFEVKADHWNQKNAFPFFSSIARFVKPAVGNKHRGYIEQLFGSDHAKRAEKLAAHNELNYNGNNLTARHTGVNKEVLKANTKRRPLIGDNASGQINKFLYYMRNMPAITKSDLEAPSREVQWKQRWNELSEEQKCPISDLQFLHLFGFTHAPQGRSITITNRGIEPVINGTKYSYDLPDYVNMQHLIGSKVSVIYDPYDMSRVLITDHEKIRFIAREANLQPRALVYQYDGSRKALDLILNEKKAQVQKAASLSAARTFEIDSKAILFAGLAPKELLAESEQAYYREENNQTEITEDEATEFNLYKNIFNR
ncbi:hypothetical protein A4H97_32085 [Niastella yeongjuensis]|uniref:Integrase catalytic domain-containing protein n=1 Tax=Niastella yeongjuensis TaxID=354355 RepID=A0A1V9EIJ1_9BACT|nr:hypothetical protein [Niastella yeongjuensis]OQP45882.1 hypothetical protein A4H97_32085 [Niastella yeongjuensis]SEP46766.1 hypothetical protein SAMN05660816_06499 [Niastella yeongjuensis]